MKHAFLFLSIIVVLFSVSCADSNPTDRANAFSDKPKTVEDSLLHEVLEGHDVAMAKMMKLSKSISRVDQMLDSVNKIPAASQNREYIVALQQLKEKLSYAEMAMNTWMEEFKLDSLKENSALRIQYLEAEKVKVNKMRDAVLGSLAQADSLLLRK